MKSPAGYTSDSCSPGEMLVDNLLIIPSTVKLPAAGLAEVEYLRTLVRVDVSP
ncbi:MAG TPA: hypothetical protein VED17_03235 [Nitrososphaerales archaeon]|nr:hypothetical protein [Nitrososphaerales archaeon]